ncbi:DUF4238 domain-containing protein [Plantibacter sp. CFBP 8775]|uniref:DUF4238 domain-containing protein n=1 Tax=Plantibacter sp. CFBP 8775 TaxID=2774038 RepID=UPI00177C1636|nr:DUF4238 domain-containing protein [Plantibacter sp. CFBP 8775]MBD8104790.1 DUF4238 domain-containing protein [Plantibacter sp. CFBP 8775]
MTVKRGHMVSRGYISAWADDRNRVEVIDVQDGRGFTTALGNATVVSYVYDPNVLTHDLERAYWKIEDEGIPVIAKLRDDEKQLSSIERTALIAFLDMHLERGRYADLVKLRVPAVLLMKDGTTEDAELALGDVMTLSQSHPDVFRLSSLPLDQWAWNVIEAAGLATGDGAVLLWRPTKDADICTISFPLSPTRLLVIGQALPDGVPLNARLAQNSRRWVVGTKGSLNLQWANAPRSSQAGSEN